MGTEYEVEYLIESLRKQIEAGHQLKGAVKDILRALERFNLREESSMLCKNFNDFIKTMDDSIDEIFDPMKGKKKEMDIVMKTRLLKAINEESIDSIQEILKGFQSLAKPSVNNKSPMGLAIIP